MKEMYHVKGTVNRGFVGQITYAVCLEQPCTALDIHLTYDFAELRYRNGDVTPKEQKKYFKTKKHFLECPEITPEVLQKTIAEVSEMSGYEISEKQARDYLIYDIDLKTEIHPLATLNDEFIGCIHKQLPDRHMIFSPEETSLGCIPQDKLEGVLKITLLVFNVAKDDTHYTLTVSAE
jgi:hypothetical protein